MLLNVRKVFQMPTATIASVRAWKVAPNIASPLGSLEALSTITRFAVDEPIYLSGEPAEFWYRIVSGACRTCAFTFDGSRQIVDFLRPGDLFGYDAEDMHSFSVEAIVSGTTVASYPRHCAERVADFDPHVARRIRELAFESVFRGQRRMLILGRATALEKISSFLLEMVDRFRARSAGPVTLPMSRYDIADYLAMAVETVSRALTSLRERSVIQFEGPRRMQIRDRRALEQASESSTSDARARPPFASSQREHDRQVDASDVGIVGRLRATLVAPS
jgi:CRP/FNR family transcriptional regulator, nitrogen fixation regulation protein